MTHQVQLCQRSRCPEYDMYLVAGSLATHRQVLKQVGKWEPEKDPPPIPPHPGRALDIQDFLPSVSERRDMSSGVFPGDGHESDRTPGPLCAPSHARQDSGPGGG